MMGHTPGPWKVIKNKFNRPKNNNDGCLGSIINGDRWYICTIENTSEMKANAALIAGAATWSAKSD